MRLPVCVFRGSLSGHQSANRAKQYLRIIRTIVSHVSLHTYRAIWPRAAQRPTCSSKWAHIQHGLPNTYVRWFGSHTTLYVSYCCWLTAAQRTLLLLPQHKIIIHDAGTMIWWVRYYCLLFVDCCLLWRASYNPFNCNGGSERETALLSVLLWILHEAAATKRSNVGKKTWMKEMSVTDTDLCGTENS